VSIVAVADTHTALWYLFADARLSSLARAFIHKAVADRHSVAVSSISLMEVAYLVEKERVPLTAYDDLVQALSDPEQVFVEASVSMSISDSLRSVSREQVPDMPDRIIAATGLYYNVPILSRDRRIRAANLQTIW
jgi:PIN domain nuclease of toxin-antitoxin system